MPHLSPYQALILAYTDCEAIDAVVIEEIMRRDIVHGCLDHLTPDQFARAAKAAVVLLGLCDRAGINMRACLPHDEVRP